MSFLPVARAEVLKTRHGFANKLIWISPCLALALGILLSNALWPRRAVLLVSFHSARLAFHLCGLPHGRGEAAALCKCAVLRHRARPDRSGQNPRMRRVPFALVRDIRVAVRFVFQADLRLERAAHFLARRRHARDRLLVAHPIGHAFGGKSGNVCAGRRRFTAFCGVRTDRGPRQHISLFPARENPAERRAPALVLHPP